MVKIAELANLEWCAIAKKYFRRRDLAEPRLSLDYSVGNAYYSIVCAGLQCLLLDLGGERQNPTFGPYFPAEPPGLSSLALEKGFGGQLYSPCSQSSLN
jgi:hypothetical protein